MKKRLLNFLLLLISTASVSQSFVGLSSDNYSGVHGVIANPANAANSNVRFEVNLVSLSAYIGNDYASVNFSDLTGGDFEIDTDNADSSNDNNIAFNTDVLGPSFLLNLSEKHSIALFTRARAFLNLNQVDGRLIELVETAIEDNSAITTDQNNLRGALHTWGEIGATYARVFYDDEDHFIKAGVTIKFLQGTGFSAAETNELSVDFDGNSQVRTNGTLQYSFSENFDTDGDGEALSSGDDFNFKVASTGIGFDIGGVYEYRTGESKNNASLNKYLIKAGLSITDIGTLNYKDSPSRTFNFNNVDIDANDFESLDLEEIENAATPVDRVSSRKIQLPTALHINLDWNAYKKFYLNLNTDISMVAKDKPDANKIENSFMLSPRYETKWLSLYSPFGVRQYSGFAWGLGLRAGPLYVGSGSLLSNTFSKDSKSIDVFFGLKVPLYKKQDNN